jgi:hypothetical protein
MTAEQAKLHIKIFAEHLHDRIQRFNQKLENDSKNGQADFSTEAFDAFFQMQSDIDQIAVEYIRELHRVKDRSPAESKEMEILLQQGEELNGKYILAKSDFIRAVNKSSEESNKLFVEFISKKIDSIAKNSNDLLEKFYQKLEECVKIKNVQSGSSTEAFDALLKMQNAADLMAIEYTRCVLMIQANALADMKIGKKVYKQGVMLREKYNKAKSDFSNAVEKALQDSRNAVNSS